MNREWGWFRDLEIRSLSNKIIITLKVGLGTYRNKKNHTNLSIQKKKLN